MDFPSMIYCRREDQRGSQLKNWKTANALLSGLNLKGRSYIIFEKEYGDYVQCAGSRKAMTIEARIHDDDGTFRHLVFGLGEVEEEDVEIQTTEFAIVVDRSQLLTLKDARLILQPWMEGYSFPKLYTQTNVNERFA